MIILGKYDELFPNMGFPSMKASLYQCPPDVKPIVLKYLKSGKIHMVTATHFSDVFTGTPVSKELVHMNDGQFCWTSRLIYYVEQYSLKLPDDFEKHILIKKGTV